MIGGGSSGSTRAAIKAGMFVYVGHANDPGDNVGDYLECNGQNVSRATYATLFTKIGTIWGVGDGSTTFTMPDSRRRSPVGKGGVGTGTLGNAVGNTGGEETHVQSVAEIATHLHGASGSFSLEAIGSTTGSAGSGDGVTGAGSKGVSVSVSNQGSSTAFNQYSPALICGVWIKT